MNQKDEPPKQSTRERTASDDAKQQNRQVTQSLMAENQLDVRIGLVYDGSGQLETFLANLGNRKLQLFQVQSTRTPSERLSSG